MIVYKITNKINRKAYIGLTTQKLSNRWRAHCSRANGCVALKSALDKYGKENFIVEKIYEAISLEDLNKKEIEFINKFNTLTPNGYNLKTGGNRPYYSEESKKKMSIAHLGNPGYWVGKSHTEDSKKRISESKTGVNLGPQSEKHKRKISASQSNKKSIICNETGILYSSLGIASRTLNICEQNIRSVLKGRRKTAGGFTFSYSEVSGV